MMMLLFIRLIKQLLAIGFRIGHLESGRPVLLHDRLLAHYVRNGLEGRLHAQRSHRRLRQLEDSHLAGTGPPTSNGHRVGIGRHVGQ